MKLLFNDINDLRKYIGALYKSQDFQSFENYLTNASYELIEMISQGVYDKAVARWEAGDYNDGNNDTTDELIDLCQEVVAKNAYLSWAPVGDITHDVNGRRMHVDEDSKAPWEWMLNNANQSIFREYQKGMNRLLNFLDKKAFSEWLSSDTFKERAALFCSQPQHIDPLHKSHWFYQKTLAFNREAQEDIALPAIGGARHDAIIVKLKANGELSGNQSEIIRLARKVIRHTVMQRAAFEFPLEYLPEGSVQRFQSDSEGKKASAAATPAMLQRTANYHRDEASKELSRLRERVRLIDLEENPPTTTTTTTTESNDDKFFMP